jgi:serine protease Do
MGSVCFLPAEAGQTPGRAAAQAPASGTAPPPSTGAAAAPRPATTPGDRTAIDRAIAAVLPSLVRVSVVYLDQQAGREVKGMSSGSGTIITTDGYVVTNHHVTGRPRRIMCTLSNFEEVPAELVGSDPLADIAVLKLKPATPTKYPAARWGDSDKLARGQLVLAMGSPLALSQSVTQGIVSNTAMVMPQALGGDANLLDGEDVGTIVRWVAHDAAIYPGNSGGPLVNLSGEIVGVNEISYGLGGAIPSNLAQSVAQALIKDGRVIRAWTGLELQPRPSVDTRTGALVAWVSEKSPADVAGLQAGDLLTRVNDTPVDVRFAEQLPLVNRLLLSLPVGRPSRLTVRRANADADKVLTLTPTERPAVLSVPVELRSWGAVVTNITPPEAREMVRASTDGVLIASLRSSGPADQAKPNLRRGDVIVELDGQPVKNVADLEARTKTAFGSNTRTKVLVGFDRGRDRMLTVVEIGDPVVEDPPREAKKAYVPVSVQVLTPPLAERLGLKGKTGVRVTRLLDGKSSLRVGDIILAVDGEAIRATAANDEDLFASTIRRYRLGSSVTLTLFRDGKEMPLAITLASSPSLPREMKRYEDAIFEFKVRDIADEDRDDPSVGASAGVLVESVAVRGWAALGRLNGGDVILGLDGKPVKDILDFQTRMTDIHARKPSSVVFEVRRGIRTMFIEIQPAWR